MDEGDAFLLSIGEALINRIYFEFKFSSKLTDRMSIRMNLCDIHDDPRVLIETLNTPCLAFPVISTTLVRNIDERFSKGMMSFAEYRIVKYLV